MTWDGIILLRPPRGRGPVQSAPHRHGGVAGRESAEQVARAGGRRVPALRARGVLLCRAARGDFGAPAGRAVVQPGALIGPDEG